MPAYRETCALPLIWNRKGLPAHSPVAFRLGLSPTLEVTVICLAASNR